MSQTFELVAITEEKVRVGKNRSLIFHFKDQNADFYQMAVRCINKNHLTLSCNTRTSKKHKSQTCPAMLSIQLGQIKTQKVSPQTGAKVRYQLAPETDHILTDCQSYGEVFQSCRSGSDCNHTAHTCPIVTRPTWPKRQILAETARLKSANPSVPSSTIFHQVCEGQQLLFGPDGNPRPAGYLWQNNISQKTVARHSRYTKQSLRKSDTDVTGDHNVPSSLLYLETIDNNELYVHSFRDFIILVLPSELGLLDGADIFCDGTFKWCNQLDGWAQVYTFVRKFEDARNGVFSYTILTVIMKNRRETTYDHMLREITNLYNHYRGTNDGFSFSSVRLDHERAMFNSLGKFFPGCPLISCNFHYLQLVKKKFSKICPVYYLPHSQLFWAWQVVRGMCYVPFHIDYFASIFMENFRLVATT